MHRLLWGIPSLLSILAMLAGVYSITSAIWGDFLLSGKSLFLAVILDSLDGRVARATKTSSRFGASLDSLVDMVNFGVAPAIILYTWQLHNFGKIGFIIVFIYCACAALRLARFNIMLNVTDKKYFIGLSSTASATFVVFYVYVCVHYGLSAHIYSVIGAFLVLLAAFSMINNVKFYSFKEFWVKGIFGRILLFIVAVVILVGLIIFQDLFIFSFLLIYIAISYFFWLVGITYTKRLIE